MSSHGPQCHVKAVSIAEYAAIDTVLQVALCEVVRAQTGGLIQAQSCQGLGQQRARVLIDHLRMRVQAAYQHLPMHHSERGWIKSPWQNLHE